MALDEMAGIAALSGEDYPATVFANSVGISITAEEAFGPSTGRRLGDFVRISATEVTGRVVDWRWEKPGVSLHAADRAGRTLMLFVNISGTLVAAREEDVEPVDRPQGPRRLV